jgi:hypothetical protein
LLGFRPPTQTAIPLGNLGTGVKVAAVFFIAWWNVSWRRFLRLYPIPQERRAVIGARIFFAGNLVGIVISAYEDWIKQPGSAADYREIVMFAAVWIVVFILMVNLAEWMTARQKQQRQK